MKMLKSIALVAFCLASSSLIAAPILQSGWTTTTSSQTARESISGDVGPYSLNTGRTPWSQAKLQSHMPLKIFMLGDNATFDSSGNTATTIRSNLGIFSVPNGSIKGQGSYLYSTASASVTSVGDSSSNPLSGIGYYGLPNGTGFTNTSSTFNGILTSNLTFGYWSGTGHGLLTVSTQSYTAGVYGTKTSVRVIDASVGGQLVYHITNIPIALSTVMASVTTSGGSTNITDNVIGQYSDNLYGGFVFDSHAYPNMNWHEIVTNSVRSNWLFTTMSQYDVLLVADLGNPEVAARPARNMFSQLSADLVYVMPPSSTTSVAVTSVTRSNMSWLSLDTDTALLDPTPFTYPINPPEQVQFYNSAAGNHLTALGAILAGNNISKSMGWTLDSVSGLGYTNRFGSGSVDTSTLAKLNVGNIFSGVQSNLTTVYDSGFHILTGGASGSLAWIGTGYNYQLYAQSSSRLVLRDAQNSVDWLNFHQGAGFWDLSPTNVAAPGDLGQNTDGARWRNIYASNVVAQTGFIGNGGGLTNINDAIETVNYPAAGSNITLNWSYGGGRFTLTNNACVTNISGLSSNALYHEYALMTVQNVSGGWTLYWHTNISNFQGGTNGIFPIATNAGAQNKFYLETAAFGTNVDIGQGIDWRGR